MQMCASKKHHMYSAPQGRWESGIPPCPTISGKIPHSLSLGVSKHLPWKPDSADLPAVHVFLSSWMQFPGFTKPFIWYHNISDPHHLCLPIPSPSMWPAGFFTAACFHSTALTKTGEIITAGPELSRCLSAVISAEPAEYRPCHSRRRKGSIVLKLRDRWHHFKGLCSACSPVT